MRAFRELKQRQRELKQREHHKFAYLVGKNNSFARPARAFFSFVHFFAVVCKITACKKPHLKFYAERQHLRINVPFLV